MAVPPCLGRPVGVAIVVLASGADGERAAVLHRLARPGRRHTTDALGRITIYTYDALSRPYEVFNPAIAGAISGGTLVRQTYTADRLRASLTDAGNNTTSFAYDGFDRLGHARGRCPAAD